MANQPLSWDEPSDAQKYKHRRRRSPMQRRREDALRDWFAEDAEREIEVHQSPAAGLDKALGSIMKKLKIDGPLHIAALIEHWEEIAGPEVARHTTPQRLERGVLHVEVDSSAWQWRLETTGKDILLERSRKLTEGAVREIRLVPAGRTMRGRT